MPDIMIRQRYGKIINVSSSDKAAFITVEIIDVNGGFIMD
jgi:hypothetical protein